MIEASVVMSVSPRRTKAQAIVRSYNIGVSGSMVYTMGAFCRQFYDPAQGC